MKEAKLSEIHIYYFSIHPLIKYGYVLGTDGAKLTRISPRISNNGR